MFLNDQFQFILKNYTTNREIFQNSPKPREEIDNKWPVRSVIRMRDPNRFPDLKKMNIPCKIDESFPMISVKKNEKQYLIKGSSGEGNMSVSPWIGIFDKDITSSARKEYAVVYLFDTRMERFYLSLNQGWTQYENSILDKYGKKGKYPSKHLEFKNINEASKKIKKNAKIAQKLINSSRGFSFDPIDLSSDFDPLKGKVLRNRNNLAWGYEMGNILSKCYKIDEIPSEDILLEDLFKMIGIYRELKILLNNHSIVKIDNISNDFENLSDDKSQKNENTEKDDKEHFVKSNAAITGNKAEEIFESEISLEMGYSVKNMTHLIGLGYDFKSIEEEIFFEIKGFKGDFGDFRLTSKEWEVAKQKKDKYILVLISNVFDKNHSSKAIRNPYEKYKNQIERKITNPSYYFTLKKQFI